MAEPVEDPTSEQLVEALATAGEIDAGIEVLDALRMRDPASNALLRLQAKLFMAEAVAPETQRAVMAVWCNGALDHLARQGALIECAVGYRVLARVFPEDRLWRERCARIEAAISPLPNSQGDPARAAIDQLIARGATNEAAEALRSLARQQPGDTELARRAATLGDLCAETPDTRAYGALIPERSPDVPSASVDVATMAARVQRSVRGGDLRGALADAIALSEHAGESSRWVRFRSALERLLAWSEQCPPPAVNDDEVTQRTGARERADLWLRGGNLFEAREAIRAHFANPSDDSENAALAARLADLDVVLDGTLPTPVPARPSAASPSHAPALIIPSNSRLPSAMSLPAQQEATLVGPPEATAPFASAIGAPPEAVTVAVQGNEDTVPARAPLGPVEGPSSPSQPPPVAGDVKVGKRKIVRLS